MEQPRFESATTWAPHPRTAPTVHRVGEDLFVTAANGTRTCAGGWSFEYAGVVPGGVYAVEVTARCSGLPQPRDALICSAHWAKLPADQVRCGTQAWDFLVPELSAAGDAVRFQRVLRAPPDATALTVRCTFRWQAGGEAAWALPLVRAVPAAPVAAPVRVAVVTGQLSQRPRQITAMAANLEYYGRLCEAACRRYQPQLLALPEIALQWGLPGHAVDLAVAVPGPETAAFAEIARRHHVRIVLGLYERDGDAVHNSAVLIAPDGGIDGRYRKVHLAIGGEAESGVLPGEDFPVTATEIGRLGCNICMDSSAAESARLVGLNGADFLVLPIMGDHRADRWSAGPPIHNDSRWLAIMRTRAMDNQLCMVVSRNCTQASCIIDRKGDVLAWNDGSEDAICADVPLDRELRVWNGGCFVDANWLQRRPHLYGPFCDVRNLGSLR
jgi:predicted amidohydrolase